MALTDRWSPWKRSKNQQSRLFPTPPYQRGRGQGLGLIRTPAETFPTPIGPIVPVPRPPPVGPGGVYEPPTPFGPTAPPLPRPPPVGPGGENPFAPGSPTYGQMDPRYAYMKAGTFQERPGLGRGLVARGQRGAPAFPPEDIAALQTFAQRLQTGDLVGRPMSEVLAAIAGLPASVGPRLQGLMEGGMSLEQAIGSLGTMRPSIPPGGLGEVGYSMRTLPHTPPAATVAPAAAPTSLGWRLQRLVGTQGLMGRRA